MTNQRIIFRIVDKNGYGMYGSMQKEVSLWTLATNDAFTDNHIFPPDDGLEKFYPSWKFAFKDIEQLRRWVHKDCWLKSMHEFGGFVEMIVVHSDSVRDGGNQVIYDPREVLEKVQISLLEV